MARISERAGHTYIVHWSIWRNIFRGFDAIRTKFAFETHRGDGVSRLRVCDDIISMQSALALRYASISFARDGIVV